MTLKFKKEKDKSAEEKKKRKKYSGGSGKERDPIVILGGCIGQNQIPPPPKNALRKAVLYHFLNFSSGMIYMHSLSECYARGGSLEQVLSGRVLSVDMLKVPNHQVAGHRAGKGKPGPLIDDSGRFYKPLQGDERGSNEVAFYNSFSSCTRIPDHIRRFFPTFYGTQLVEASDGSGLQPHLVLHDLTVGRVNPSIMDIKIGSRTWPPQASEDYIEKCLKKDKETSSLLLGFRLSGLEFYNTIESGYWKPDRKAVLGLSAEEVKLVLRNFVSSNVSNALDTSPDCAFASIVFGGSTGILSQLLELKAWFEDQTIYHFYSCSVHIMFEKELALERKSPRAEIMLIDFAHVVEGQGVIDHNFLGGLCSLIKFISEILTTPDDYLTEASSDDDKKNRVHADNGTI